MRKPTLHLTLLVMAVLSLMSCDRTPRGVLSVNGMSDLITDLLLAESYIDSHYAEFPDDSTKQVLKQSVFKKHGITQQEYDSSLVWYAHNMEEYTKAYQNALNKLKERNDKLELSRNDENEQEMLGAGGPTHQTRPHPRGRALKELSTDSQSDSTDLWKGPRRYTLTQGARRGFITFDLPPDAGKRPGDRYQLAYKLTRGGNEFKVSLNVDYTDGSTSQISRPTLSDGWVTIDVQSDTARQVRRVYGYVSYDIKRGHIGHVDSLMLMRTHFNKDNYGIFHGQRLFKRQQ